MSSCRKFFLKKAKQESRKRYHITKLKRNVKHCWMSGSVQVYGPLDGGGHSRKCYLYIPLSLFGGHRQKTIFQLHNDLVPSSLIEKMCKAILLRKENFLCDGTLGRWWCTLAGGWSWWCGAATVAEVSGIAFNSVSPGLLWTYDTVLP